jgi:hypothetical protein
MRGAGGASVHQLADVFGRHATIRQLILGYLDKEEADTLRQVSRAVRVAVNHNVTTVRCGLDTPPFEVDLATAFPGADKLRIFMRHGSLAEIDTCVLLEYISAASPAFVSNLRVLTLSLGKLVSYEEVTQAIATFLSRCEQVRGAVRLVALDACSQSYPASHTPSMRPLSTPAAQILRCLRPFLWCPCQVHHPAPVGRRLAAWQRLPD